MRRWNRWNFQISSQMLLIAALMFLVLPPQWVFAAIVAAVWHELCHVFAVKLCKGRIQTIVVGADGAVIECMLMKPGREAVCILAGPLGRILLLSLANWLPRLALCGCFHGLYNFIPVYPLDGGRALRTLAFALLPPERAEWICTIIGSAVMILIVGVAFAGTFFMDLGALPVLLAGTLLFRMKREKLLANFRDRGYNRPTIVKR